MLQLLTTHETSRRAAEIDFETQWIERLKTLENLSSSLLQTQTSIDNQTEALTNALAAQLAIVKDSMQANLKHMAHHMSVARSGLDSALQGFGGELWDLLNESSRRFDMDMSQRLDEIANNVSSCCSLDILALQIDTYFNDQSVIISTKCR